jgi:hypothetical protein
LRVTPAQVTHRRRGERDGLEYSMGIGDHAHHRALVGVDHPARIGLGRRRAKAGPEDGHEHGKQY